MQFITILFTTFFIWFSSLQTIVKTQFKVFGNCTECKERIEQACDVKGVQIANWDIENKQLLVKFDAEKISLDSIHALVAAVGHDTEKRKAPDSVYVKLPVCCLYRDHDNTHHD